MSTRGGVASFVRQMRDTPLWAEWDIRHVATHRDGSVATKIGTYAISLFVYCLRLMVDRPSIVHLHMSSSGSFLRKYLCQLIARFARVPVVVHVHGSDFGVFYERSPKLLRSAIRASLGSAAAVIALGEPWAVALRDIAPRARITVVPNAIRPARAVDQRCDEVRMLFLGRVGERKGTFTLLEAWHRLKPDNAHLVVAGDGEVERARRTVAELGLEQSVEVTGWLSPQRIAELIEQSHVFVLPSHREGQPMAVLEAMAHGLCVITSPVGGIPDLIDERCGMLVPPGAVEPLAAALDRVLRENELRARLGAAALDRVRAEFDIEVVWRRFARIYREVLG
ncbi:glycosyltransferase family 1 protein [Nocardia panacis]|uniref:Glycosyltransferase family 1 protein n=2 Tax=Nocardia panacis TaxID=2340916 RepID=A0A3A4KLA1_9NOCA|nr:glycosyltransferase family 1 protein [Nocardia panacis]